MNSERLNSWNHEVRLACSAEGGGGGNRFALSARLDPFFYRYPTVAPKRCCPLTSKRPTRFSIGGNRRSNCDDPPGGPDDRPPQGKSTCNRPNGESYLTPFFFVPNLLSELISYCAGKKFVLASFSFFRCPLFLASSASLLVFTAILFEVRSLSCFH